MTAAHAFQPQLQPLPMRSDGRSGSWRRLIVGTRRSLRSRRVDKRAERLVEFSTGEEGMSEKGHFCGTLTGEGVKKTVSQKENYGILRIWYV